MKRASADADAAPGGAPFDVVAAMPWRLSKLHPAHGLDNTGCESLLSLCAAPPRWVVWIDFMIDAAWLQSAFPYLTDPAQTPTVVLWAQNMGDNVRVPRHWVVEGKEGHSAWGSHHTKAVLLGYDGYMRVIVHTANLLYADVNNKTQGVWWGDFPEVGSGRGYRGCGAPPAVGGGGKRVKQGGPAAPPPRFGEDLAEYLAACQWRDGKYGKEVCLRRYDFACAPANVRLIGSVPGRHTARDLHRWGHMKLRAVLKEYSIGGAADDVVYCQFSSCGSLKESWLQEFLVGSLGASSVSQAKAVWPTEDEVCDSVEGYNAGLSVPGTTNNVAKLQQLLLLHRWGGMGRDTAMPHIKTYTKVAQGSHEARYSILTSSNLSMAAWGKLEKNGAQLHILNWELGVVVLPTAACPMYPAAQLHRAPHLPIPLPFPVPPTPYARKDRAWVCDNTSGYARPDVFGKHTPTVRTMYGITQD